jgi:hypothetical protein
MTSHGYSRGTLLHILNSSMTTYTDRQREVFMLNVRKPKKVWARVIRGVKATA